jgi:hypothetical protein
MKTINTRFIRGFLLLGAITLMSWTAAGTSLADDHHDAWSHDKSGYWDNHGRHQAYVTHENHHGYWRTRDDGSKFFISID